MKQSVSFICKACNGTGHSRYWERRDCDVCDGRGTITSYIERELRIADAFTPPDPFSRKV